MHIYGAQNKKKDAMQYEYKVGIFLQLLREFPTPICGVSVAKWWCQRKDIFPEAWNSPHVSRCTPDVPSLNICEGWTPKHRQNKELSQGRLIEGSKFTVISIRGGSIWERQVGYYRTNLWTTFTKRCILHPIWMWRSGFKKTTLAIALAVI